MSNLINIVLVDTIHPGNIGSVARAMKTMGLKRLSLVNPRIFPSDDAVALSGNATDVLKNATVYKSIKEAIKEAILEGIIANNYEEAYKLMLEEGGKLGLSHGK